MRGKERMKKRQKRNVEGLEPHNIWVASPFAPRSMSMQSTGRIGVEMHTSSVNSANSSELE